MSKILIWENLECCHILNILRTQNFTKSLNFPESQIRKMHMSLLFREANKKKSTFKNWNYINKNKPHRKIYFLINLKQKLGLAGVKYFVQPRRKIFFILKKIGYISKLIIFNWKGIFLHCKIWKKVFFSETTWWFHLKFSQPETKSMFLIETVFFRIEIFSWKMLPALLNNAMYSSRYTGK